ADAADPGRAPTVVLESNPVVAAARSQPPIVAKRVAGSSVGTAAAVQGLKDLANANRPKGKKRGAAVAKTGAPSSSTVAGKTAPVTAATVAASAAASVAPTMVTRGAGKRPPGTGSPQGAVKRPKVTQGRTGVARGKAARQTDQSYPISLPPLAATDTEAAELAFHTVSDQLDMPSEYTATSQGCNRRLAGIASQFFFSAQIGFSQIIMLNDRLSKTVDENVV
ncbi:unnamed protein product, partial [Linum tenue]